MRYFGGMVALSNDRSLTPDEIMDRLEKRVGPEGRKLFEQFLRKVNKLQMQQHLEAQARMGVTDRSRDECNGVTCARSHLLPFYRAAARSSQSLMRRRIATAPVRSFPGDHRVAVAPSSQSGRASDRRKGAWSRSSLLTAYQLSRRRQCVAHSHRASAMAQAYLPASLPAKA
jgi:hypothetical protein